MAYLPCLNPSCQSHGKPHPNCRCYGNMAEGGEIGHYCASNRAHMPHCEYFAAGGMVGRHIPQGIARPALAALVHGGANMLFGAPKSSVFGAFGSGGKMQAMVKPEDELQSNLATYGSKVVKGDKSLDKGVGHLFQDNGYQAPEANEKELDEIRKYIEQGGVGKELEQQQQPEQALAEGGKVADSGPRREDPLSGALPEHSMELNSYKAHLSNYLEGNRPQEIQQKLPFDPNKSQKVHKKEYEKLLQMAAKPLSVLDKVKKGNLTHNDVLHFVAMYPQLHDHMVQKMTEHITKAQLEDRKPPYKTRQAMAMFMGAALDSSMTPQNIQAAQGVFAQKAAQQQQAAPKSNGKAKGKAKLSDAAKGFETANQAAEARQKQ